MKKAKLVKRAEMTILGTVALALFCSAHIPGILSALDTATSTDPAVYSASAATPYVENTATAPAPISDANVSPDSATGPVVDADTPVSSTDSATASPDSSVTASIVTASSTEETPTDTQ